jgi:hypothetical protein
MRGALLQTVNQPARQAAMATTRVFVAERLATIEAAAGPLALAAVMGAATYHLASEAEHARQAVTGSPWARLRYSRAPAVFQEMFLEMQEQGYSAEELASFTDRILAMSSEEAHERALAASRNSRSFSGTITVHGAGSSSEDDSNDETSRLIWRSVDEEDLIDLQDVGQIVPKGDVLDPVLHVQGAETAFLSASLTTRGASHFDSGLGMIGLDPELLEGTGSTILWHEDLLAILRADRRTTQTDLKNAIRHEEVLIEGGIESQRSRRRKAYRKSGSRVWGCPMPTRPQHPSRLGCMPCAPTIHGTCERKVTMNNITFAYPACRLGDPRLTG